MFLAYLFTPGSRFLGLRFAILDYPAFNKIHKTVVPRSGGIAIFIAFWLSYFLTAKNYKIYLPLFSLSFAIFLLGLYDDKFGLKPYKKLFAQLLLTGFFTYKMQLSNPLLATIIMVTLINAFNLMDGLNGLATILAIMVAICLIFLLNGETQVMLFFILAGVCSGFLCYNLRKNYIFMGDGGSLFIGFILSYGAVSYLDYNYSFRGFLSLGIVFFLFLLEIITTVLRRIKNGKNIFHADLGHIYNIMIEQGLGAFTVLGIYFAVSLILIVILLIMPWH